MLQPPTHGGNLRQAAQQYQIPFENWIDLSTGINPHAWKIPKIPDYVWQRLPEEQDGLLEAAQQYYATDTILAVAGSQAAIQTLPACRKPSRVGIISPAYAEYAYWWQQMGHEVISIPRQHIERYLPDLDVLIVINPNNPDAFCYSCETLLQWHQQLSARGGWLIVDEAFMDSTPENSLIPYVNQTSKLIILRSLGKFFGLAGIRLGFVISHPALLEQIQQKLGSWATSHPARWIGKHALCDQTWQNKTRQKLKQSARQLQQLVSCLDNHNVTATSLFAYLPFEYAQALQDYLAKQSIWIRIFEQPQAIRIGLPRSQKEYDLLGSLLERFSA